jgi:hypothetical protein
MPSQNTASRTHLKNSRSVGNSAYTWKGATSRVISSKPKVSFRPNEKISPGNYGCIWYSYEWATVYIEFNLNIVPKHACLHMYLSVFCIYNYFQF